MDYKDPQAFESIMTRNRPHRYAPPPSKPLVCVKCGLQNHLLTNADIPGSLHTCPRCGVIYSKASPLTRFDPGHPLYKGPLFDEIKLDDTKSLQNAAITLFLIGLVIFTFIKFI